MNKPTFFISTIALALLWSCVKNEKAEILSIYQEANSKIFPDSVGLVSNTIIKIPIDKNISLAAIRNTHVLLSNDTTYLVYYDFRSNQAFFHPFYHQGGLHRITLPKEGPGSLVPTYGNKIRPIAKDLAIFYERKTGKLKIYSNDTLQDLASLPNINDKDFDQLEFGYQGYELSYPNEMLFRDSILVMSLTQQISGLLEAGYETINNLLIYNLKTESFSTKAVLPDFYLDKFWGKNDAVKFNLFSAYGQTKLVYGFGSQAGVWFEGDTSESLHFIGSKYFDRIEPAPENLKNQPPKASWKWTATTPRYEDIIYNDSSGHYYRIALHGMDPKEYDEGKQNSDFSLIIFNRTGLKIGEVLFEKGMQKYDIYKCFAINGKFYLMRKDLYNNESDNYFYFEEFSETLL